MNRCIVLFFVCLWSSFAYLTVIDWEAVKERIENKESYSNDIQLFNLTNEHEFIRPLIVRFIEEKIGGRGVEARYYYSLSSYSELSIVIQKSGKIRFIFDNQGFFDCTVKLRPSGPAITFPENYSISPKNDVDDYVLTIPFSIIGEVRLPLVLKFEKLGSSKKFIATKKRPRGDEVVPLATKKRKIVQEQHPQDLPAHYQQFFEQWLSL